MKKRKPFRQRSWRFYRNWMIFMIMWGVFLFTAYLALRSSWLIFILWMIPAYLIGSSIYYAYYLTHPRVSFQMRNVTPGDAGLEYEQVEFPSRDGHTLFGWYVPSRNGVAVILVHGGGSRGIAMIYHATAMALYDYGVLMFDLRAHGSSDGDTCTAGWREVNDLLGAVDFVQGMEDIQPHRIGVLGISLGGQVALRAASQSDSIRAVVAEGPSPAALSDLGGKPTSLWRWIRYPLNWFYYSVLSFFNGAKPPPGIRSTISSIAPRPILLISAGKGKEQRFARELHKIASDPKELWELPEAKHGGGYFYDTEAYAARVAEIFDAALLDKEAKQNQYVEAQSQENMA